MATMSVVGESLQGDVAEQVKKGLLVQTSSNQSLYFVCASEYLKYLISHGESSGAECSIEPCGPAGSRLQVQTSPSTQTPPSDHDDKSPSTETKVPNHHLHHAVLTGNGSLVKTLVKQCPSSAIDSTNDQGFTLLMCAALTGAHETATVILKAGASPDISHSTTGATPLSLACLHGHHDLVKLLLKHRANSHSVDHTSCSPLHYAVWGGSVKVVKVLLSHLSTLVSGRDCIGRSGLHLAAARGDVGLCQLLMKKGCSLTETDDFGRTSLHWAILSQQVSCVEQLLAKNSSLCNQADSDGATPVHYAAMTGKCDLLKTLLSKGGNETIKDGNGYSPLFWACACGRVDIVKQLINLTARETPSVVSGESTTDQTVQESEDKGRISPEEGGECLRVACAVGSLEVCQLLLQTSSCLLNEPDKEGRTALYMASYHGHTDCVDELLETGASPYSATLTNYSTSVHVASERGHCEVVARLLAAKANIYCSLHPLGDRSIHLAAQNGHSSIIIEILRRGCVPDVRRDSDGRTALHQSAEAGHMQCCRLLVEGGANPTLSDTTSQRLTALDVAMLSGHSEIANYLISVGARSGGGKFHRAALTIQAVWRLHRHRRRERSWRVWSVSVIQRAVRRWRRRRIARRVRDIRGRVRNRAARVIQTNWRLYIEGKRRYEASCARLRAKLHQERLATSLLLDELYSQSHSISLPLLTSPPLSTRRLPATLLQASAPLPGPRITSAALLSQTFRPPSLPRSRPRKPLTRTSRPKPPLPPTHSCPAHPLREGEREKEGQIRLPNLSPSQPLLLSSKRKPSESGVGGRGQKMMRNGMGVRKSKSDTDSILLPTVTGTGLERLPLTIDDSDHKGFDQELLVVDEDRLPPLPQTPSLVSPPPLLSPPSPPPPSSHPPPSPPTSLSPPLDSSSNSPPPPPPPDSPLHTSPPPPPLLPSHKPSSNPSTTTSTTSPPLIQPDTSEPQPSTSDYKDDNHFTLPANKTQSQATSKTNTEERSGSSDKERVQRGVDTRPYLRQTMFRASILGQDKRSNPLRQTKEKEEEKERENMEEEEKDSSIVDDRLLGPIQRFDKLNQVLGLLQKVQVAEREGEEGLRLVDLHHHIQSALDEAVRLRADTESLHHTAKVKLEEKHTNSVH